MTVTTNLPTFLSFTPQFFSGLQQLLSGQELPSGFDVKHRPSDTIGQADRFALSKGSVELELSKPLLTRLKEEPPKRRAHLLRLAPKVLAAVLSLSVEDTRNGFLGDRGRVALARCIGDGISLSRLLERLELHPDRAPDVQLCLALWQDASVKLTQRGKEIDITYIFRPVDSQKVRGTEIKGRSRGGTYRVFELHPELVQLLYRKFIQLPLEAFKLKPRHFNAYLALLGQRHLRHERGKLPEAVKLSREHALDLTGATQHQRRGSARGLQLLKTALGEMVSLGLLAASQLKGAIVAIFQTSTQQQLDSPEMGAKVQRTDQTSARHPSKDKQSQGFCPPLPSSVRAFRKILEAASPPSIGGGELVRVPLEPR